jgi:F-type H+-transporting ATPase subunit b
MKTGLMFRFAVILALMAGGGMARSADVSDEQEAKILTKEAHGAEHTSGLSRLDLGFWTLIVFGVLLWLLSKYAWGPIMKGLEKREGTIASHHADAEKARGEAEKLLMEIKSQRAKASEEMAALIAEARRDADAFREAEKLRTAGDIQAERDRLKREIATARDQALSEIWEKTVQLATLVSSKAIGRVVTADDHRRLVDESLAELGRSVGGSHA